MSDDTVTHPSPFRPRRLRIEQAGWAGYTGHFGTVLFQDGVSVDAVTWQEQQRLGGLIMVVSAEENEIDHQVGPSAELVRGRDLVHSEAMVAGTDTAVTTPDGSTKLSGELLSREELEDIADRKGIAGLRDVAKAWNVKGRSVSELIGDIVEAQDRARNPSGGDDGSAE